MKLAAALCLCGKDPLVIVKRMADAQIMADFHFTETIGIENGAIACVRTSDRFSKVELSKRSSKGNLLLIAGVPFTMQGNIDLKLDDIVRADAQQAAKALGELDGAFNAFHWDQKNHLLTIVTDRLGAQPLYWAKVGQCILIATELKAFPASGLIDVRMDRGGWGAFIALGFTIGRRTQLAGVQRVDAATVMIINPENESIDSSVYWHWPEPRPALTLADVDSASMVEVMENEMRSYLSHRSTVTTLLSGGFDSRIIMATLRRAGIHSPALTVVNRKEVFGVEGNISMKVAEYLNGGDLSVAIPSPNFYSSASYLKYLVMNEVGIPSLDLFIANVWKFVQPDMNAVWEGVGPGYGFVSPYPAPGGFPAYRKDRIKPLTSLPWQTALKTFSEEAGKEMFGEFEQMLQEEMTRYTDDEFGVSEFHFKNQLQCRLGLNPYKVLTNFVLPFTPCISKEYLQLTAGIPFTVRGNKKFYMSVLQDNFPNSLKVPICSGGKFYSSGLLDPLLWAKSKQASMGKLFGYYWHRLPRIKLIGPIFQKAVGYSQTNNRLNPLVHRVIQAINPDQSEVNADMVRMVQVSPTSQEWPIRLARSMLFYWQIWRWIMEERLTMGNAETFHEELYYENK